MSSNQGPAKGALVIANGWPSIVMDGYRTRPTRLCYVFGFCPEMGSVYASDIQHGEITREAFLGRIDREAPHHMPAAIAALNQYCPRPKTSAPACPKCHEKMVLQHDAFDAGTWQCPKRGHPEVAFKSAVS